MSSNKDFVRQQRIEDMRAALAVPECRRVFARMLAEFNLFGMAYAPGDAMATAYNEGVRSAGRWLMAQVVQTEPGAFVSLLAEDIKEGPNG